MSNGKAENLANRLLQLRDKRDKAKSQKDQLDGQLKGEYGRLEKKFGCKSIVKAKEILSEKETRKEELIDELEKGIDELEEKVKDKYE